jgi:hypothetical protein
VISLVRRAAFAGYGNGDFFLLDNFLLLDSAGLENFVCFLRPLSLFLSVTLSAVPAQTSYAHVRVISPEMKTNRGSATRSP